MAGFYIVAVAVCQLWSGVLGNSSIFLRIIVLSLHVALA